MKEIYKDIPNYEGLYKVSNRGNVKALDRYNVDKNGKKKFYPGKLLKADTLVYNHTNYNRVTLSKNGKTKRFQVHRLVALVFIPTIDTKLHINHIDNNGTNNNVENLEWVTHSENMLHAQKQGRLYHSQSKGGKTLGDKLYNTIQTRVDTLLHTHVGKWYVKDYVGLVPNASHTRNSYSFNCVCECGFEQVIDSARLQRKATTMCLSCRKKENTLQFISQFADNLKNTVTEKLRFTGSFINTDGKSVNRKNFKFEILNTDTMSTEYISFYLAKKLLKDNDIV